MAHPRLLLATALACALALPSRAQSNLIPGTDVSLGSLGAVEAQKRSGSFPNGVNGIAMTTTSCNKGSVDVPWKAAMHPDHPFIAFMVARERDGRLEQISDYSSVKHGFFALTQNACDNCTQGPFGGGDFLGVKCSDTYTAETNGDNFWLGPAEEVDPWLGEWDPVGSHFDQGEPPVSAPQNADGNRSLTQSMANALNSVPGHRVRIEDADLVAQPGDLYWYQGQYVVRGEPTGRRDNNLGTRRITPSWNGSKWNLPVSDGLVNGSVLQRWTGASVGTVANGGDDGRYHVGVRVSGPFAGLYHYEYAIHNQDANRALGELRIPLCSGARVENAGFRDIDGDASNDWSFSQDASGIRWNTGGNPLRWNSIYNFWFDSDAAPLASTVELGQHFTGGGANTLFGPSLVPQGLYNVYLGDGCSNGTPPELYPTGSPAIANLGNASFAVEAAGNEPAALAFLFVGVLDGALPLAPGCDLYMTGLFGSQILTLQTVVVDGGGLASFPLPIPNNPNFEGVHINTQVLSQRTGGGPVIGLFDLSNGLRVRLGDSLPGCP